MKNFEVNQALPESESDPTEEKKGMSRRSFLRNSLAAASNFALGKVANEAWADYQDEKIETDGETEIVEAEEVEEVEEVEVLNVESDKFWNEESGYFAQTQLRYDEIQFVDEENVPVGLPVQFEDFVVDREKINDDGAKEIFKYKLAPGPVNEVGMATKGIAGEWITYVKEKTQDKYPDRDIAGQLNVATEFIRAYNLASEPVLQNGIANGEITTYVDLVRYFSEKPVVGAEKFNRSEYVQNAIEFTEYDAEEGTGIPPVVEAELRRLVPGLCAQESKFNADVVSPVGARGVFQFMPETWAEYGGKPEDANSLPKQTEVAGQFFSDLYKSVQHFIGEESLQKVRERFADETIFQRDFLVPCIINSYNAGARRVGEGVDKFIRTKKQEELPVGKDLFREATHFMESNSQGVLDNYRHHAQSYTARVYAQAQAISQLNSS